MIRTGPATLIFKKKEVKVGWGRFPRRPGEFSRPEKPGCAGPSVKADTGAAVCGRNPQCLVGGRVGVSPNSAAPPPRRKSRGAKRAAGRGGGAGARAPLGPGDAAPRGATLPYGSSWYYPACGASRTIAGIRNPVPAKLLPVCFIDGSTQR